jgi:Tol biopolymer transport system component
VAATSRRRRTGRAAWRSPLRGRAWNKRQLTQAGQLSEYPSWSPSGRELVFSGIRGGNFEIVRISARGGRERNLTDRPAPDKWPDWSPDGREIAFERGDDVYVMRA